MGRKLTTQEFIEKAKLKHGDRYDYSNTTYIGARVNTNISCRIHGEFNQLPTHHFKGVGCPKCALSKIGEHKLLTKEEVILKFKEIHGNKYNYNKVIYIKSSLKVIINCPVHGDFSCSPNNHKRGKGCPKCGIIKNSKSLSLTFDEFVDRSKNIHGNKYDYSLVEYKNNHTKVKIKCKEHGVFNQTPTCHLSKSGCPECAKKRTSKKNGLNSSGWRVTDWEKSANKSIHFDSFKVYIIKCWNDNEQFYKIGRTYRKVKNRFAGKQMPYNYEIIKEIVFKTAKDAFNKETELKRLHKSNKYIPNICFGGMHECYSL